MQTIPENSNEGIVDGTAVEDVQVVPATFGDKLVKFQSYRYNRCKCSTAAALNEPGTFVVRGVVTCAICYHSR